MIATPTGTERSNPFCSGGESVLTSAQRRNRFGDDSAGPPVGPLSKGSTEMLLPLISSVQLGIANKR